MASCVRIKNECYFAKNKSILIDAILKWFYIDHYLSGHYNLHLLKK